MLHTYTLAALRDGLARGDFSSRELTQHFLQRIGQYDSSLNSFITVCADQALRQADAADAARTQGTAHALAGIPIAQKDIFCTQGVKTTCASKMLDNFISPYNATVISKSEAAGLVMLGKTNMDEFAMGSSNETSYYGGVKNPWDLSKVPGGSSGGSAAAVAARLAPAATGTDTGG
ncbi:MAG TPA: amidase, partial [Agitococcus sp.]|nr:amidase [Agitococcus sp.]